MKTLTEVIKRIQSFESDNLSLRINLLEREFENLTSSEIADNLAGELINSELLESAWALKSIAGQINVVVHSVGILLALPYILEDGELIENLSLGAGNTGRNFDLETNYRVAEFKFISWKGSAEAIRQNQLFKDFFNLAECEKDKRKYLFVLGTEIPLQFLTGGRALSSVCSKNKTLWESLQAKYGNRFIRVSQYYNLKKDIVTIIDLKRYPPFEKL